MAYERKTFVDDTTPAINETHMNGMETYLSNLANNAEYKPLLGSNLGVGNVVLKSASTWGKIRDGDGLVDGNSNVVMSGGIASGLTNLVQDTTYYSHDETGLDTASYDTNFYSEATLSNGNLVIHNSKIYNILYPNIYQHSYVKGNITGCTYDTKSFDVSTQMTSPEGMAAVASKVFIANSILDTPNYGRIYQYSWTPDDISTCSYDSKYLDVFAATGVYIILNIQIVGSRLYVFGVLTGGGGASITIEQFYLSSLTDITTATHEKTHVFDMTGTGYAVSRNMRISGGKLYVVVSDGSADNIMQFNFPDYEDVTKTTNDNKLLDTSSQENDIYGIEVDDEYIYVIGNQNKDIFQYSMTAPEAIGNISSKVSPREAGYALSTTELHVTLKQSGLQAFKQLAATTYTLVLDDLDYLYECTNAATQTITVPTNANEAFPVGSKILFAQYGAGVITLLGDGGVTVNGGLRTSAQWATGIIEKTATDTWLATMN